MIVQIHASGVQSSDALDSRARQAVDAALRHVTDRVTRVEVHLHDDNADKAGANDKRVTMEARVAGQPPVAVEAARDDLYAAIDEAGGKLGRAVASRLEKMDAR